MLTLWDMKGDNPESWHKLVGEIQFGATLPLAVQAYRVSPQVL
jgi:hypothetical protein